MTGRRRLPDADQCIVCGKALAPWRLRQLTCSSECEKVQRAREAADDEPT